MWVHFFCNSMLLFSNIKTLRSQMQCPIGIHLEVSLSKPGFKVVSPTGGGGRGYFMWEIACRC